MICCDTRLLDHADWCPTVEWVHRPDLCEGEGHPGVTYNPLTDKTWCLCGERVYKGNQHTWADAKGGPLREQLKGKEET